MHTAAGCGCKLRGGAGKHHAVGVACAEAALVGMRPATAGSIDQRIAGDRATTDFMPVVARSLRFGAIAATTRSPTCSDGSGRCLRGPGRHAINQLPVKPSQNPRGRRVGCAKGYSIAGGHSIDSVSRSWYGGDRVVDPRKGKAHSDAKPGDRHPRKASRRIYRAAIKRKPPRRLSAMLRAPPAQPPDSGLRTGRRPGATTLRFRAGRTFVRGLQRLRLGDCTGSGAAAPGVLDR